MAEVIKPSWKIGGTETVVAEKSHQEGISKVGERMINRELNQNLKHIKNK